MVAIHIYVCKRELGQRPLLGAHKCAARSPEHHLCMPTFLCAPQLDACQIYQRQTSAVVVEMHTPCYN
jgi:hypothetical protein